jgi:hypothetical protein
MRIALLGLPQAGKRTLFALLTGRTVPDSRRPDEWIEGTAAVQDPRVDALSRICNPEKTTYAENQFALCPDVQEGSEARAWLEAARKCDLLCLVIRGFPGEEVYHPAGSVSLERDRNNLLAELILADMVRIETRLTRLAKEARSGLSQQQRVEEETLRLCQHALESDRRLDSLDLPLHQVAAIRSLGLLTLIPVLEVWNVSEVDLAGDPPGAAVKVSVRIEQEIMEMEDPAERLEFLDALGLCDSGLNRVSAAAYEALGLMSFYTIGPDEVRAWTIRKGATAPVAGGKIHSDIERGFIRVEVISYDDLVAAGSEKAAKQQGKAQQKGRDYVMQDGDICHFLFNV